MGGLSTFQEKRKCVHVVYKVSSFNECRFPCWLPGATQMDLSLSNYNTRKASHRWCGVYLHKRSVEALGNPWAANRLALLRTPNLSPAPFTALGLFPPMCYMLPGVKVSAENPKESELLESSVETILPGVCLLAT